MAKSKSGRRSADTIVNANPIPGLLRPTLARPVITPSPYLVQHDEREYTPLRLLQPMGPGGAPARIRESRPRLMGRAVLQFASPAAVDICRKRKDRREVLFAKRRTGKGSKARYRNRKEFTGISCK